jgi:hypothetical protein
LVACQILQRTLLLSSALVHGAFRISSSRGRSVSWLALVLEETTMVLSIFNRSYGNGQEIFRTIHSYLIKLIRMINLESFRASYLSIADEISSNPASRKHLLNHMFLFALRISGQAECVKGIRRKHNMNQLFFARQSTCSFLADWSARASQWRPGF